MTVLAFAALAAAGTFGRWQLQRLNRPDWPTGTLIANVAASFALGLLHGSGAGAETLAGVALIGSFSTFSTVVRETVEASSVGPVARYLTATLVLGLAAAWVGLELA